ncbi:MAG: hypothetical protein ABEJ65_11985, partial [bacterium]
MKKYLFWSINVLLVVLLTTGFGLYQWAQFTPKQLEPPKYTNVRARDGTLLKAYLDENNQKYIPVRLTDVHSNITEAIIA